MTVDWVDWVGSNLRGGGGPEDDWVAKKELIDDCDIMSIPVLLGAGEASDMVLFLR